MAHIKRRGLTIGSGSFLKPGRHLEEIDAVWGDDHDGLVQKRNRLREQHKVAKHIFISQICDVAVEEYATVCPDCSWRQDMKCTLSPEVAKWK